MVSNLYQESLCHHLRRRWPSQCCHPGSGADPCCDGQQLISGVTVSSSSSEVAESVLSSRIWRRPRLCHHLRRRWPSQCCHPGSGADPCCDGQQLISGVTVSSSSSEVAESVLSSRISGCDGQQLISGVTVSSSSSEVAESVLSSRIWRRPRL